MNVAQQRDFYKLRRLTPQDLKWLRLFLSLQDSRLHRGSDQYVQLFEMAGMVSDLKTRDGADQASLAEHQRKLTHNFEEELYCRIEGDLDGYIRALRQGEYGCLSEKRLEFLCCVASQYFRTKGLQETICRSLQPTMAPLGASIENCWPVLRHIFPGTIAVSVAADASMRLVLLKNSSPVPFITGDQPAINTRGLGPGIPPTEFELFYPISPTAAVLVTDDAAWKDGAEVPAAEARRLNDLIVRASTEWLFVGTEAEADLYALS